MKVGKALARSIEAYYQTLREFEQQRAFHEGAVSVAFQTLLSDAGRGHGWTLIPQLSDKRGGAGIRPDGTLKDQMSFVRGHWEAKDTSDNLDDEIVRKRKKGYPLDNIIFEDTRQAVLIQNKAEVMRVDLKDPEKLAGLLGQFFGYIEPQRENFEHAVNEFKERVPELALALKAKVGEAHQGNKAFKEAFARFFELCQATLNPNISKEAVDDMLVQHLLTERLIREIFDNPEFTRRNVIAAEIEKVIDALTSKSFNRDVFLKSLDRFYVAIENAARTITDWSDKQHFLNTIYERFFQGYSVKLADTMGIVYTPQPIVDFMCASVAEVLEKEFGKTLGSPDVNILDPCTGTGNFVVNLMNRIAKISKRDLPRVYRQQMFANEIMLLPYYIAAMNIEHEYCKLVGEYEAFDGLCFVDTLDLAESHAPQFSFMTAKNTERVERQKRTPITVIIGNPPYNAAAEDENDNNRNRKYPVIDARIRETYVRDSAATLKAQVYDPFVRFFRWGLDRLGDRDGIICYVTNNAFVSKHAFDGMRKHLRTDFTKIFHIDLHGDVRENPKLSGTTHNVFGIQVGVGITLAIKQSHTVSHVINYHRVAENLRREEKLAILDKFGSVFGATWTTVPDDDLHRWKKGVHTDEFQDLLPIASKAAKKARTRDGIIFESYSAGVKSNRDDVVYEFDDRKLAHRMTAFIEAYNSEVDRYKRAASPNDVDDFVSLTLVQWDGTLKQHLRDHRYGHFAESFILPAIFRPFTRQFLYFDRLFNNSVYLQRYFFPPSIGVENIAINVTYDPQIEFSALVVDRIPCLHLGGRQGQAMPFYVYDEDGTNRRENITDWALDQFRTHYKDKKISKWDIFYYVYGVLHHPGYRSKFADNLKRELPRIPFAPDFRAFADSGKKLASLHLDYEKLEPWKLAWTETAGEPLSYRVEKMKLVKPKIVPSPLPSPGVPGEGEKATLIVNTSLAMGEIPPEVFEYRLGNRSALEWVIDQYQVSTDKRSGIVSDPNREDDPEYIVRLVGQVVRVSVETVGIVRNLPGEFGG